MVYDGNPKHKHPWQHGRKGSLCPTHIDAAGAQTLLDDSIAHGGQRYATDGEIPFCAQQHDAADDRWHGYPLGWRDVPPKVRQDWIKTGKVDRRTVKRHWEG